MSLRALALDWSIDGPVAFAFLALTAAIGAAYLSAAALGSRRDRRGRRWPRNRTICFLTGLLILTVDLDSGIGTQADARLAVHMVEHMLMWVVIAPLLAAGAPVRLAFFALSRGGRQTLAGCLRSRPISVLTSPTGSVSLFAGVILITHVPAVFGLALHNDWVHEAEHGLYIAAAVLMWAPLLGVDPLPHRVGPRGQIACLLMCMLPMALIAVWLGTAQAVVYSHYGATLGASALPDQRLAATIMLAGGLPALAVPALLRARGLRRPRQVRPQHAHA